MLKRNKEHPSKHVVQAQRKFAVGAVVPLQPERRVEPAPAALPPPPPEPRDVRYCGVSATQLLNSVMMMGIHTHTVSQPVVVLERLYEHDNDSLQIRIENVRSLKTPSKITKKKKEPPSKQASCRSLRSKVVHTNGGKKRRRSESSVTDVEDNRPLKFFRKTNRDIIQKNTFIKAPPKSTSTKLKRFSLRQMKLRLNKASTKKNEAEEKRVEKPMASTKITKTIKPRKKGSSDVREGYDVQVITSRVRARTASHTRGRNDATVAPPPSPSVGDISSDPAIALTVKRSPDKVKTPKATQFRRPRPRRRPRLDVIGDKKRVEPKQCASGNGYCGSCEHCSLVSSAIAMGDTEQGPDELERVVADLVDRARRFSSAGLPAYPHTGSRDLLCDMKPNPNELNRVIADLVDHSQRSPVARLSSEIAIDDTEQKPNEMGLMVADIADHSPSAGLPACPHTGSRDLLCDMNPNPNELNRVIADLVDHSQRSPVARLSSEIAIDDTEQKPNEMGLMVADIADHSPSAGLPACPHTGSRDLLCDMKPNPNELNRVIADLVDHSQRSPVARLSSEIAIDDTEQKPNEMGLMVADIADHSPSAGLPACPHTGSRDLLSKMKQKGDTMPNHNELKRVIADPVDRSQRSSVALLSSEIAINDTEQTPNEMELMVADIADHSPSVRLPASTVPATSPGAAPDVYIFNEESEVEAGPSPFRATRPRQVQCALSHPPRSHSLDQALTDRAPDTNYIIRALDTQAKALTSYVNGRVGASKASHRHVKNLLQFLKTYRKTLLNDSVKDELSTKPVETLVIDDDDEPKREPEEPPGGNSREAPLACHLQASMEIPRAPSPQLADDDDDGPEIAEAPAFYPTKEEMRNLNSYVEKVEPVARKYGIFKIVPPRDFQPPCQLKNIQFKSTNQNVSSMFSRWGPAASEMTAIKAHLATQNVAFTRPPLFEGVEVDLVKLYQLVQEHGGLIRVMEECKWAAIAEKMQLNARAGRVKADVKLDKIYMKHLLPYETLSEEERKELRARVAAAWRTRYQRQLARTARPLHRQRRMLGESESSDEGEEPEPPELATAFLEVEDCVVSGSNMNLTRFRRVGERVRDMRFPGASADAPPHWAAVERAYWRLVRSGTEHVCVHGAALDTSQDALGFPAALDAPYGNHPWNLKRLGESEHNVLSSLGPTLAVTVPTLHLGMMFSTNCWHRDPHHLPWTEYMHQGPPKIWYGIADSESGAFRAAAEQLCPTAVQQKALWLPSDTVMLPPRLLAARGVRLVRALQAPGEYLVVLPRAFSCSISTGLTISESLYFAGNAWLDGVDHVFAALRADSEPSMFALEALLEGVVKCPNAPLPRLLRARALLRPLLQAETRRRREAAKLGVRALSPRDFLNKNRRCSKTSWQVVRDECHVCRATLHWSKIVDASSRVSVCLEHGLRLVQARHASAGVEHCAKKPCALDGFTTILFYSDHQISQLIRDLDKPHN